MTHELQTTQNNLPSLSTQLKHLPELSVAAVENSSLSMPNKMLVLAAFNAPKISQMPMAEFENTKNLINNIVIKAIFDMGVDVDPRDQSIVANDIVEDIIMDYSHILSLDELGIIFRNGPKKVYGEFFGKNGVSRAGFTGWINAYLEQTKAEAKRLIKTLPPPPEKQTDPETIKYWNNKWFENLVIEYKKFANENKFEFYDTGNLFYNFNKRQKIVALTVDEVNEIYTKAETQYKKERDPKLARGGKQAYSFNEQIYKYMHGDKKEIELVKGIARQIAVRYIFNKFKVSGQDFEKVMRPAYDKDCLEQESEKTKQKKYEADCKKGFKIEMESEAVAEIIKKDPMLKAEQVAAQIVRENLKKDINHYDHV